ncbi:FabD/lysophospholipase-like protein, partial [Delitschia confertaspora ATCC 74209]
LEGILLEPKETSRLSEAEIAQPACTAVQIAIFELLDDWSIAPSITVNHSSREIGAAYGAGLISAPEAIIAAFYRGLAVKQVAPVGFMLAVGLGVEKVSTFLPHFGEDVVVSCKDSPNSVTLSGTVTGVQVVKEKLETEKLFTAKLCTGKAYHSDHMNAVAPLYEELLTNA